MHNKHYARIASYDKMCVQRSTQKNAQEKDNNLIKLKGKSDMEITLFGLKIPKCLQYSACSPVSLNVCICVDNITNERKKSGREEGTKECETHGK